jgi:heat shock protein 4
VRQAERAKNVDSVLTAAEISKQDELIDFAMPTLTRPKPKPPKDDGAETPRSSAQTPDPPPKGGTPKPEMKMEEAQGSPMMGVD